MKPAVFLTGATGFLGMEVLARLLEQGDRDVLALNRRALAELTSCTHELAVVPGATHLFEEPGALERVAELATAWFVEHLRAVTPP